MIMKPLGKRHQRLLQKEKLALRRKHEPRRSLTLRRSLLHRSTTTHQREKPLQKQQQRRKLEQRLRKRRKLAPLQNLTPSQDGGPEALSMQTGLGRMSLQGHLRPDLVRLGHNSMALEDRHRRRKRLNQRRNLRRYIAR